jgi:anthranilate phosphoribosyltransferase
MKPFTLLLKKKGIGASMGKHLIGDDFAILTEGFLNPNISLTTKATLLTALLCLEATEEEAAWISKMKENSDKSIPSELQGLIFPHEKNGSLFPYITQCIQGKDLSYTQCQEAIDLLFDTSVDDYLKAAFLEAERLKRETLDENKAFLDGFYDRSQRLQTDLPLIIDIANPYDGFNRNLFLGPFIAATLGALGYPTLLHGINEIAPKNGVNAHKLLDLHGINTTQSLDASYQDLKTKGWAYVDQSITFPELYALKQMRIDMVKRPVIATVEKFLQPIRAKEGNVLVTGYTHPAYKDMTKNLIDAHAKTQSYLFFRGTEGSAQLGLDRRAPFVFQNNTESKDDFVSPDIAKLATLDRIEPNHDLTSSDSLQAGLAALNGTPGFASDTIVYNCLAILKLNGLDTNISPDSIRKIFPKVQL